MVSGRLVEKHEPRHPGEYFRHVLIVMKTADSPVPGEGEGNYIVQQRSLKARFYPGKWDFTGGGVLAGETPADAAVREVKEELHLDIPADRLYLAHEEPVDWDDGSGLLVSIYACRAEVPAKGFEWNQREVNDVRVFPFHVFRGFIMDHNGESFGAALDRIEDMI